MLFLIRFGHYWKHLRPGVGRGVGGVLDVSFTSRLAPSNEGRFGMSDTGIVRRVDDLGRIVLPMELRRTLGINVKDPMSISVDGERIIVSKHHDSCVLCGS